MCNSRERTENTIILYLTSRCEFAQCNKRVGKVNGSFADVAKCILERMEKDNELGLAVKRKDLLTKMASDAKK